MVVTYRGVGTHGSMGQMGPLKFALLETKEKPLIKNDSFMTVPPEKKYLDSDTPVSYGGTRAKKTLFF